MINDILARLCLDPGQRTLGQLMQDREGAVHEIQRLRSGELQVWLVRKCSYSFPSGASAAARVERIHGEKAETRV